MPAGASNLTFNLSGGTGDADMYVKFGAEPTSSSYDCRPYASGNTETCTFATPSVGTYYVKLNGYSAASGMSLKGSYTTGGGGGGSVADQRRGVGPVLGRRELVTCYTLDVPSGKTSVVFNQTGKTGTTGDADLYVKYKARSDDQQLQLPPVPLRQHRDLHHQQPERAGTWYACSRGYSAYTNVTMKGTY